MPPRARFWSTWGLLLLAACAGYAAALLASMAWPEVAALPGFYFDWQPRPYTEAEFRGLRAGLGGLAAGAALLGGGLAWHPAGRAEWRALGYELRRAGRGLPGGWQRLRPGQRRLALAVLAGLTGLRVYYSFVSEPYDDAISFEVFVRARLLALSACYPIPNNHILSNTLAWVFYQLYPGFWWSMRLPVLLLSTAGTGLWGLGLLRWANFRVALGAVAGFGVLQLSLYHATVGRGYWLLIDLAAVGFFSTLVLTNTPPEAGPAPAGYQRLAALGLLLAGVLGLYTVPTGAYFLASAYGWLALAAVRRADGRVRALACSGALGVLTLLGAGLLYAPLLLVSGPALLFKNPYVASLAAGTFWHQLPAYWWTTEGWLAGQRLVGAAGTLLVLGSVAALSWQARTQRLPAGQARLVRGLGRVACWFVLLPYAVVLGQRVQAPERTLLYKAQLLFVLAAVVADWLLRRVAGRPGYRWAKWGLVGAGLAFAGLQVAQLARHNAQRRRDWAGFHAGFEWLAAQPPGPVLAPGPAQRMLLRFYAHAERVGQPWQIDAAPHPGTHYRYLVSLPTETSVPGGPPGAGPPAFHSAALNIFVAR